MSKFFSEMNAVNLTPRQKLERRYKSSLSSLLLIAAFSSINLGLLLMNSDRYFLFSSYIPYLLGDYAMFFSGRYPEEYYSDIPDIEFFGTPVFAVFIAAAVLFILFYLICWLFARKNKGVFLVLALSLFVIDTLVMFIVVGFSLDMLTDVIFHIWALVALILGVSAHIKLKELPEETETETGFPEEATDEGIVLENSPVLRISDPEVKGKTFVEADFGSMHIAFRRTKRVNELIVNGNVYDEYEVLFEKEHCLSANVNGHRIEAVYDGKIMCYINVDGKTVAKKARLI